MATVAASVAVGVGVKMTKRMRERRTERARQLGLVPGEALDSALQRMALGQLDLALTMLDSARQEPDERAVHETRKALKRLRALLRLLEPELGRAAYERESTALRDAARRLAGARDAEVMLATLDHLIERNPRKLLGRGPILKLRATLLSERERARAQTLGDARARAHVVAELSASRARVQAWCLPHGGQLKLVQATLVHLYRQGSKRMHRAAQAKRSDMHAMHRWRKRVKDLRYVAQMLQPAELPAKAPKGKRARRRYERAHRDAKRLHRIERLADRLGEILGEDHDLAVLAQRIEHDAKQPGGGPMGSSARKALLRAIRKRRRELQKSALADGKKLYRRSPPQLGCLVRSY